MSVQQGPPAASRLDELVVREAMYPGVISCPRGATLPSLAAIMVRHGIHAAVVSALERGTPLVVTGFELVRAAVERPDARAGDLAREPIAMLPADAALAEAVEIMAVRYVTHLLATDPASGAPEGVLSSLDVAAVAGGSEPRLARVQRPAPARPSPSVSSLSQETVGDAMHPGVVTCAPDARLSTVARIMADHRVHCVAVAGVDGAGVQGHRLTWGLIADIDLMLAIHGHTLGAAAATIAATSPLAVQEDESLDRAATLMVQNDTSHLVVVDDDGLPSGIVSTLDIASVIAAGA